MLQAVTFRPSAETRLTRFTADEEKRARLRLILSDPVMIEAMAILKDLSLPRGISSHAGVDADTTALSLAMTHATQAGAHEYARMLERMCDEPGERIPEEKPTIGLAKSKDELPADFTQRRGARKTKGQ
jgi:hypothetical protein